MDHSFQYIMIIIGVVSIIRGIMILMTGKLPEKEEAAIRDYSPAGVKRYKFLSSAMNIVGGIFCIVVSIVRILNLVDLNLFRIVGMGIIVLMIVAFVLIKNSCKNIK